MQVATERFVPIGLGVIGAIQALTGALALFDAGAFYDQVASYPPENGHFIRDIGTFQLAYGAALLWSIRAPSWRLPLIAYGTLQFALHAINHLIDIGDAEKDSQGVGNFVLIAVGAAVLGAMLHGETRRLRRDA